MLREAWQVLSNCQLLYLLPPTAPMASVPLTTLSPHSDSTVLPEVFLHPSVWVVSLSWAPAGTGAHAIRPTLSLGLDMTHEHGSVNINCLEC